MFSIEKIGAKLFMQAVIAYWFRKNDSPEIDFNISKNGKPTLSGEINRHQNGDNLNFVFLTILKKSIYNTV